VALNPNLAAARHWNGWTQVYLGNIDAAMEQFSTVLRLSPLNPRLFLTQTGLAYAHFFAGRYDESLFWATGAVQNRPNFLGAQRMVMASLAMSGRIEEARRSCAAVMQADPTVSISSIRNRTPLCRSEDVEKLGQAYRIAGVPE
jgi:tetratricopeptide (TPR) repeat protein